MNPTKNVFFSMVSMFGHKEFNEYLSQVIDMSCSLLVVESVNSISGVKNDKFGSLLMDECPCLYYFQKFHSLHLNAH